jgi:hypothetical protein
MAEKRLPRDMVSPKKPILEAISESMRKVDGRAWMACQSALNIGSDSISVQVEVRLYSGSRDVLGVGQAERVHTSGV